MARFYRFQSISSRVVFLIIWALCALH